MLCRTCQLDKLSHEFYACNKSVCKACYREKNRTYHFVHRDSSCDSMRRWQAKNREHLRAYQKAYHAKMREALRPQPCVQGWLAKSLWLLNQIPGCWDPKKCKYCKGVFPSDQFSHGSQACRPCRRIKAAKYRRTDGARKARRRSKHRRAARLKAGGSYTAQEWAAILMRYKHQCALCGTKENLTVDHITPLSKGGSNFAFNLRPLCHRCNSIRGANTNDGTQQTLLLA